MTSEYQPGTHIGPYVVKGPLRQGGMGHLLVVTAPANAEELALKVIRCEKEDNEQERTEGQKRFKREVRILEDLRSLQSPHFLKFIGAAYDGALHYLVTEYLKGETLSKLLADTGRRTNTPEERAPSGLPVWLFQASALQLVSTLELLHRNGIAHRDLKPDNIMTTEPPDIILTCGMIHLKLIDFGIGLAEDNARLTRQGMPGTPLYSAPETFIRADDTLETIEQACARDRFALGLVLYELWTGKRFWTLRGNNLEEAFIKQLKMYDQLHLNASRELQDCPHQAIVLGFLRLRPEERLPLVEALKLINSDMGGSNPAATGDLRGPGSYQGETYRSDDRPTAPSPKAAFHFYPTPEAAPPDVPGQPSIQFFARPGGPLTQRMGLTAAVVLALGGAFLALRAFTGETLPSAQAALQDQKGIAAVSQDPKPVTQPDAQMALVSAPTATADLTGRQPLLPASSPPVTPAESTREPSPPIAGEDARSIVQAKREPAEGLKADAPKVQAPLNQRPSEQPVPPLAKTRSKPLAPASESLIAAEKKHSKPSEPEPPVQVATKPDRKLVLDSDLIFQKGDSAPMTDRGTLLEIRATRPDAPARAMAEGKVYAIKGCGNSQACTVEVVHSEKVITRYEGCASTTLKPNKAVKKSDIVCYLNENDSLSVSALVQHPGKGDELYPLLTDGWTRIDIKSEASAANGP